MTTISNDRRARRNVSVLVAAQAFLGSQMPMIFVIGGLAGTTLATNPCLATLPISLIVFGSMTTAPWLSPLMQRHGRRAGFFIGAAGGAIGAAVSAFGLYTGSFALLLVGSYLTGIYMSAQGFFRFAATDAASDSFKPRAISYVMAGGLVSAILGPQLNKLVLDAAPVPYLGTYMAVVVLNLVGMLLFFGLDLPKGPVVASAEDTAPARSKRELIKSPRIVVAVICAMVSYSLMNLVMTSAPLAVVGSGFSKNSANDIVSAHVLAMYVPSFFTGYLINRFGVERIMAAGLFILAGAGVVALSGVTLSNFFGALILLGLGWNFGFIGATTMLASAHAPSERGRVQGMNDTLVFGFVTIASLASGGLMNCAGSGAVHGWTAVNLAMVPFLVLAVGALFWLLRRERRALRAS